MKVVYLAAPFGGDPAALERAKRWLRWCVERHPWTGFVADWILHCEVMPGDQPAQREAGLLFDEELVRRCDEFWMVGGRVSPGMQRECSEAIRAGKLVLDLTGLGAEPPTGEIPAGASFTVVTT